MSEYRRVSNRQAAYASSTGGLGFFGALAIVFIVLKLTGVIDWAWVWVLSPLWFGLGCVFGIVILAFIVGMIMLLVSRK